MRAAPTAALLSAAMALGGCASVGHIALEKAVLSYDETTAQLERQMLLLNVARRDNGLPVHFTVTGQIAASFDWSISGGVDPQFVQPGFKLDSTILNLRGSARESPTFSIYPITGSEFAERILTPLNETFFNFLVFQGGRVDATLRLLAAGVELHNPDGSFDRFVGNSPETRAQYEEFRRMVLHLQWLSSQQKLFVRSLVFDDPIIVRDAPPQEHELKQAYGNQREWREQEDGRWALTRTRSGRIVIMNVDPLALSHKERSDIQDSIGNKPPSYIYVDIRPGEPGGDLPIHGMMALRSIAQVIDFVAESISEFPEHDVQKASVTGEVDLNPTHALRILRDEPAGGPIESVSFEGHKYSLADTEWDRANFQTLNWLFQAAQGEISSPGLPITIAK